MSEYNSESLFDDRTAMVHLLRKALSHSRARELAKKYRNLQKQKGLCAETVACQLQLSLELLEAGIVTFDEYVFFVDMPVEHLTEKRLVDGECGNELGMLEARMEEIERRHGLLEGHYWRIEDAPSEYQEVSRQYDEVLEQKLVETLEEFQAGELAKLRRDSRREYYASRERGRKRLFEAENVSGALAELINVYETEAAKAAANQAFLAAAVMLGSAAECQLLFRAQTDLMGATKAFQSLSPKNRKKQTKNPMRWSFQTLIEVATEAGWLSELETSGVSFNSSDLASLIRIHRNNVHPARYVKDSPYLQFGQGFFDDVQASYAVLRAALR